MTSQEPVSFSRRTLFHGVITTTQDPLKTVEVVATHGSKICCGIFIFFFTIAEGPQNVYLR